MLMTTLRVYDVMRVRWHWNAVVATAVLLLLLVVDVVFFVANLLKIAAGGYVPLLIGAALFFIMTTWRRGTDLLRARVAPLAETGGEVLAQLRAGTLTRVPGSAVFLSRLEGPVPPVVRRHVTEFKALPAKVVVLAVVFADTPRVAEADRIAIKSVHEGIWQVTVRFGFVEIPNLMAALQNAHGRGVDVDLDAVTFFVAHDEVAKSHGRSGMTKFRRLLFGFLYRNAVRAADRFALPRDRLVEVGHQVEV